MLISIIIPAFNEERFLANTLEQIKLAFRENEDQGYAWEIIVCDNNSTDKTAEIASQLGARVLFEPVNQIARARNTGAGAARGEWLLFIDADSFPSPELIADVFAVIDSGDYIGCGTTVLVEGGTLFNKLRMERLNPLFRIFNWCGGAFLLCRTEAFHAVGGFSLDLYAFEEIDFVIRLKRYGRTQGKQFIVLHGHPVITSGRRGDTGVLSLGRLFASNFAAVILFGLHYVLPRRWNQALGARLLGYWYGCK